MFASQISHLDPSPSFEVVFLSPDSIIAYPVTDNSIPEKGRAVIGQRADSPYAKRIT